MSIVSILTNDNRISATVPSAKPFTIDVQVSSGTTVDLQVESHGNVWITIKTYEQNTSDVVRIPYNVRRTFRAIKDEGTEIATVVFYPSP